MARTSTKSVKETTTVTESMVANVSETENEDMKEIIIENNTKEVIVENNIKDEVSSMPLEDSDEIDVISLIPNVVYEDNKTDDVYEWNEVGHVEIMTFETLKNMWRNYKGYFKNMWLKPLDNRVINKFGIAKTFEKYEFLMDGANYTRANIKNICSIISNTPNGLKYSIVNKIKDLIVAGKLSDIVVIRELEKYFDLDLVSFLN